MPRDPEELYDSLLRHAHTAWEAAARPHAARELLRIRLGLVASLELHKPAFPYPADPAFAVCEGCDPGDYAEGPPLWPCSTITKIADALGEPTDG